MVLNFLQFPKWRKMMQISLSVIKFLYYQLYVTRRELFDRYDEWYCQQMKSFDTVGNFFAKCYTCRDLSCQLLKGYIFELFNTLGRVLWFMAIFSKLKCHFIFNKLQRTNDLWKAFAMIQGNTVWKKYRLSKSLKLTNNVVPFHPFTHPFLSRLEEEYVLDIQFETT